MTTECVAAEENHVGGEDECAESDSKVLRAGVWIGEPEGLPHVVREEDEKDQREGEEIAVNVLDHERKRALAAISFARLADSAVRRVRPERFVVGSAIVIARDSEAGGKWQDDQRG